MTAVMLFDTDNWIVLTSAPFAPAPRAYGPFESRAAALQYAERNGEHASISVTVPWHEPEWVTEYFPPDFGAVWFNGDWNNPFVVGPFYDVADAMNCYGNGRPGFAVALEFPEEEDDCAA